MDVSISWVVGVGVLIIRGPLFWLGSRLGPLIFWKLPYLCSWTLELLRALLLLEAPAQAQAIALLAARIFELDRESKEGKLGQNHVEQPLPYLDAWGT